MSDSNKQQIIERWDTFLSKIKERANEMFTQANQGTDYFIPQLLFDNNAIGNAWTGIKSQIFELSTKMNDAWQKMRTLFDDAGAKDNEIDLEYHKKVKLDIQIQWDYEKFRTIALGKAARHIMTNVKAHINESKEHRCTQCGSPFNVNIYSVRAKNIKCDSCGSVNTFKPDDRIVAMETWVLVPLADEYVLTEKETEFKMDWELREKRNVSEQQIKQMVAVKKATVSKYYQFLSENNPEKAEYYIRQRDERLKWAENARY
jgi:hypothetical protein